MIRHPSVSRDRWLVSYADFMTLLCAFFAMLYAASLVNAAKPTGLPPAVRPTNPVATAPPASSPADDVRGQLEQALRDDLALDRVRLVEDPRGLVIEIPEATAFGVGQEVPSPGADDMLRRLAAVLAEVPNGIRVEGHTDDTPIATSRFQSNWDLSTARATAVIGVFVTAGLPPRRLSAAGYAQFKPRASNDSADGRARNRRVDVVVMNRVTERREEPLTTRVDR